MPPDVVTEQQLAEHTAIFKQEMQTIMSQMMARFDEKYGAQQTQLAEQQELFDRQQEKLDVQQKQLELQQEQLEASRLRQQSQAELQLSQAQYPGTKNDYRSPVFESLDQISAEKQADLTNTLVVFFEKCDLALAAFGQHVSFSKEAQDLPTDTRLADLLLAALPLQFRLSWQRRTNLKWSTPNAASYNTIKESLLAYAVLIEFGNNMAA